MTGWLLVSLPPNEMTNKTLAELFKICNSSWGYLVEPYSLLLVSLGMPCTSPRLRSSATASVSWMIQYDPRDPWNCHMIPIVGDEILVGGDDLVVNGEFVLWIIPSKFSPSLSFMALFNSSISFLMLRSSFSILEESSLKVLSRLLAWEFDFLHFDFLLFTDVLRFGIPLSFTALHSGESALPH